MRPPLGNKPSKRQQQRADNEATFTNAMDELLPALQHVHSELNEFAQEYAKQNALPFAERSWSLETLTAWSELLQELFSKGMQIANQAIDLARELGPKNSYGSVCKELADKAVELARLAHFGYSDVKAHITRLSWSPSQAAPPQATRTGRSTPPQPTTRWLNQ